MKYKLDDLMSILPEKIGDVILARESAQIENVDFEDAMNRRATKFNNVKGDVVVVPIHGYISHKATIWSAMGMESSSETIGLWVDALMSNPSVGAIVFDVDSPGGTAAGLSGVSEKIYNYRGKKPMIAVVNDLMASAAYFIGSAADEIVADPDSLTGSIGTIMVHFDYSQYLENMGIKTTIIKSGKYKAEANPYEPLSDDAKDELQSMADEYYQVFLSAVARNRNTTPAKVKSDYGEGRVFRADKAKSVGMVDRIATLEQVIRDMRPKASIQSNRVKNEAYAHKARAMKMKVHG